MVGDRHDQKRLHAKSGFKEGLTQPKIGLQPWDP